MKGAIPILLATIAWAGAASAQDRLTVRVEPTAGINLGMTVRGSSASVFSISPAGTVTRVSGDAIRMSNAPVTPPAVVIQCMEEGRPRCTRPMRVRVVASPRGGRSDVLGFRLGALEGARLEGAVPPQGPTLDFDLTPSGAGSIVSFTLGLDVRVDAGADGRESFNYMVMVLPH